MFSAECRSGAESTNVPSRSQTIASGINIQFFSASPLT
jgi:hypothetical protein